MEITLLVYHSVKKARIEIEQAFIGTGIKVIKVKTLTKLHILLASRYFDAILVDQDLMNSYCVAPARHLWACHSRHCIITWHIDANGEINMETHRLPDTIAQSDADSTAIDRIKAIETILRSISPVTLQCSALCPEQNPENLPDSPTLISIPIEFEVLLHKKLRLVCEALLQGGNRGTNIEAISQSVWGSDESDKKKDIQAYICRLRSKLQRDFPDRYRILLSNNRYRLIETIK